MCAGLSCVRAEVASNLSTTTSSLPPVACEISWNRATILSRPQPGPRLGSSQEAIDNRVPHVTNESISARMDFSSTEVRTTAPEGRAIIFGLGAPATGSAGSRHTLLFCATGLCEFAAPQVRTTNKPQTLTRTESPLPQLQPVIQSLRMSSPQI